MNGNDIRTLSPAGASRGLASRQSDFMYEEHVRSYTKSQPRMNEPSSDVTYEDVVDFYSIMPACIEYDHAATLAFFARNAQKDLASESKYPRATRARGDFCSEN